MSSECCISDLGGEAEENSRNAGGVVCFARLETVHSFVLITSWKKQI